jgi:hypothetical protein
MNALRQVERLERRCLLSLVPLGDAVDVPGEGPFLSFDVGVAGNGGFIVARIAGDMDPASDDVQVLRYSAAGAQIGSPITIAAGTSIDRVSVSADADGDAVVAYDDGDGIYVARVSNAGVASAPVRVADGFETDVSMSSGGEYFLAWTEKNEQSGDLELRVRAFGAAGTARGGTFTAFAVNSTSGSIFSLEIDASSDGSGAVVAAAETFEGAFDNVEWARVSAAALVEGSSIESTNQNEGDPAVAVNTDGSFEIGYTTYDKVGGSGGDPVTLSVLVQRFDAAGATQAAPIVLWPASADADVPKDIFHTPGGVIALDALPDGGFLAAYSRAFNTGVDFITTPLFVQRFDAQGAPDVDGPLPVEADGWGEVMGVNASGTAVILFRPETGTPLRFARVSTTADFASLQNGLLRVAGTAADESISVALSGADVVVTRGTETRAFAAAEVNVLLVDGFDGNDTITNDTSLKATLRGGDGDDTIFGGSGADRVHGGVGRDSLWGRDGVDRIYGEDGIDSCYGNGGNDRIEGGAQPDHIRGNGGRDKLFGNGGNDKIYGGESGDWIYGQPGNDQLFGEGGNDRLYGDDGYADTVRGGAGNDVLIALDSAIDVLFGDGGRDTFNGDDNDILTSIEVTA